MRLLLVGALALLACNQTTPTVSTLPSSTGMLAASVVPSASSPAACERESLQTAGAFVSRFNSRDLAGLTALFTDDASTYWLRRGDPVTNGFKEGGRVMIGRMLQERMTDGEILAYDRLDPDPSPTMHYAEGTGQLWLIPRFVGLRGAFPDGGTRTLGAKFVYACGQRGIVQLLILS